MNRTISITFIGFLGLGLLSSCATSNPSIINLRADSRYCYPSVILSYDSMSKPLDSISMIGQIPAHTKYSRHTIMVANAAGVLKTLKALDEQPLHSTEWWQLHQQIVSRLFLVSTEIESMAAELDCEGERADQVADFITQNENQRVKKLTVLSIVSGALAGIGNAALKSHGAAVATAVVGGALSAGLGLSALLSGQKIVFTHPRNLLTDFWTAPASSKIFPPPIWYMLSEKYFSNEQIAPIVTNMKRRWVAYEGLKPHEKKSDETIKLLFGEGGKYDADDLRSRARMLNQVQAAVKLMNQDLQGLVEDISR
jgi:hypothetical protein